MKNLVNVLRRCRSERKEYKIDWKIVFEFDTRDYIFFLLPTIMFQPWPFRWRGVAVISICWFNMNLGIGIWTEA